MRKIEEQSRKTLMLVGRGFQQMLIRGGGFLLATAYTLTSPAQVTYCDQPWVPPAEQLSTACGISINYAPIISDHTPIKTIRIALHSFQKDDGTGNFQNTPGDVAYLQGVMNSTNGYLSALGQLNMGTTPYISDSRIRLELVAIYYHPHDSDWMIPNSQAAYNEYVVLDLDGYGMSWSDKFEVEHVLLRGPNGCCSGRASGAGSQGWINTGSWYSHYLDAGPTQGHWKIPQHFMHELTHALGLSHNFQNCYWCPPFSGPEDQCDGCYDNDPVGNACPNVGESTNMQDYPPLGYDYITAGLSECQLGKIHYNLDGNAGTISQIVVNDYCIYDPAATINITASTTWLSSKKLKGDVIIQPGTTLTIKCRIHMPSGAKVIIKPGAKLIVDEGLITNLCGEFWQGIEIQGDNTHNQTGSPIPTHQGMVVMKNDATIEHAREALNLMGNGWSTFGGVVQCTDAHFLNCRRSAQFMSYQNTTNAGTPINNRSYFTRCEFKIDDAYRGVDDFYAHVSMWDVSGIRFRQCDFINAQTTGGLILNSDQLGYGIISLDAGYNVTGACDVLVPCSPGAPLPECPTGNLHPSRFIGLDHGIHALSSGLNGRTFGVTTSYFENNICGVFSSGVNNFGVTRNQFVSGGRVVALTEIADEHLWDGHHRAVYNYGGMGFRIEENTFSKYSGAPVEVEGSVSGFTGAHVDQVYRNITTGMDHAFVAEGNCSDNNNDPSGTGLGFYCNKPTNNASRDFVVRVPLDEDPNNPANSIRIFQGSPSKSAGNEFTPIQNGPDTYFNYDNEAQGLPITYFWQNPPGQLNANSFNAPWVQPYVTISPANTCPSLILCPGGQHMRAALVGEMASEQDAYMNLKYVFESLLDGGDFDELSEAIMTSWPEDAWELRNELISRSPYLSVEILKEVAIKNILPQAMLLEVCLANPEATQRDGFARWIELGAPHPLPHYMVEQIMASWDQTTWRTNLEAEIARHKAAVSEMNDRIIVELRNDSVPEPLDSILVRWHADPALGSRVGEVQTLMEMRRFIDARTLAEELDERYVLKGRTQEEQADLLALVNIYGAAHADSRDAMHLNTSDLAVLRSVADGQVTQSGIWAQNMLCFGYQECYPTVTGGTMPTRAILSSMLGAGTAAVIPTMSVYPSPASAWLTVSHNIRLNTEGARIVVRDVAGREVESASVAASPGQWVWDVRTIPAGTYTVELRNGAEFVNAQRVVLKP